MLDRFSGTRTSIRFTDKKQTTVGSGARPLSSVGAERAVAEVSSPPGTRIPAPRVGRGKRERTYGFNCTQTSVFLLRA